MLLLPRKSVSLTALWQRWACARGASGKCACAAVRVGTLTRQRGSANVHAPETTGKFVAATFEHDTARPVEGYAAPQLHTHAVTSNVTRNADNGQHRAFTAAGTIRVAAHRYQRLSLRTGDAVAGFGVRAGACKHGQPEIKGYTKSIWRPAAHAGSRSKTISANRDWMSWSRAGGRTSDAGQQGAAIARESISAAPRVGRAVWTPGRPRCGRSERTRQRHAYEPTESRSTAVTYAAIISSSVPLCWTGATFWKPRSAVAWVRRLCPRPAGVRAAGCAGRVFARRIMPEQDSSTPPPRCFAWNARSLHECRRVISAG